MGPSENTTKLALGLVTATGAVVLSYFLLKKLGLQAKGKKGPQSVKKEDVNESSQPTSHLPTTDAPPQPAAVEPALIGERLRDLNLGSGDGFPSKTEPQNLPPGVDEPAPSLDGDNQSSYIFIKDSEAPSLDAENKKISDRSSDESSYDVIEDEEREKMEKEVVAEVQNVQEALNEAPAEASMVFVGSENLNKSAGEMSSSSFYTSADELLDESSPVKASDRTDLLEDISKETDDNSTHNAKDSEEDSGNLTVISRGESKSEGSGNEELSKSGDPQSLEESTGDSSFLSIGTSESDVTRDLSEPPKQAAEESSSAQEEEDKSKEAAQIIPVVQASLSPVAQSETTEEEAPVKIKPEEISSILTSCADTPAEVTVEQLTVLAEMLARDDLSTLRPVVLDPLVRVTAFSQNNSKLRSAGIPTAISALTLSECQSMVSSGVTETNIVLPTLCSIITNLTLDPENSKAVEDVITPLVDLLVVEQVPESLLRSLFLPLINFSSDPAFHTKLTRLVQHLLDILDNGPAGLRIQALRILVNLSLNNEVVPSILAAKSPECLPGLVDQDSPNDLKLRTLTFLYNLESAVASGQVNASNLPVEEKAESPSTVFSALTGVDSRPGLRNKVFAQTQNADEDIRNAASKLYQVITTPEQQEQQHQ